MLRDCKEEDFYELKCVAEDRMRPDAVPAFLWGNAFVGVIITFMALLANMNVESKTWTYIAIIDLFSLGVTVAIAIFLSSIKRSFRFQKLAALAACFAALKLPLDFYQGYFMFAYGLDINYIYGAYFLILGGFILSVISTIRSIKRVKEGALRKGGKLLFGFQKPQGKVNFPLIYTVTVFSGVVTRTLNKLPNKDFSRSISTISFLLICVVLHYLIALVVPEFFLMVYCKFRFDSFIVEIPPELEEELNKPKKGYKDLKKSLKITTILTLIIVVLSFIRDKVQGYREFL